MSGPVGSYAAEQQAGFAVGDAVDQADFAQYAVEIERAGGSVRCALAGIHLTTRQ